ncbi:hypothetical protein SAMN04488029_1551 [Reichenbachiella faecimaris]|uniref:Outer membrane protein beta-barrel domain-containing protein n=1 Tax=Reichenbachiella faecimaris TaxID=692418 RepID=A0A1W2G9J8_REIFA|nr:DUF6048 family protein [Reichenbachiella faecimaris]SMD33194.1 hypothetical protein SAMN04488029_1551 [Reichenbachiella faecimaris]
MRTLKYIISLFVLIVNFGVSAQEIKKEQKVKKDFMPSEVIFATDVIGLGKTLFSDETKLEFHSKIDFHHYYLAGELGIDKINLTGEGFDYSSDGTFFRLGPHVNMMPYNKHRSSIFFGIMYARSSFSDHITYAQSDTGWGEDQLIYSNENLEARWFEANMGINVNIAGPLYMGYTVRFKFSKKLSDNGKLFPFEIPGFGQADKGSQFGFNYYVIYKLRFRDKPIPKRPVKIPEKTEKQVPPGG